MTIRTSTRIILLTALSISLFSSCKDKVLDKPDVIGDPHLPVNATIADIKALYVAGAPIKITSELTFSATVIADDKSGNLYKQIVVDDGTAGISIAIDRNSLYADYPVGRKIYIKCKGLYLDDYNQLIGLYGGVDISGASIGIASTLVGNYIVKGPVGQAVTPIEVEIKDLDNTYQNRLIKLTHVEFMSNDAGKPYADAVNKASLNRTLTNCSGNQVIVRTSGYANFASIPTPVANGDVYAIYTVFGSTKQLIVRDTTDLDMRGTKCDGTSITDTYLVKEDFESANTTGDLSLNGWVNFSSEGTKKWQGKTYNNNKYVQVSAFSSSTQEPSNVVWLVSPKLNVGATLSDTLSFETKDGYDNGATLAIMYSADYTGSGDPSAATWTLLSAAFSSGSTSGYAPSYTKSGKISLSGLTGNIYLAFRYTGGYSGGTKTTTFQLDNVMVVSKN